MAQYDHATPRPPHRFAPAEFVPWVQALREGFEVHVVYEACGFGYGLYRALLQAGAYCYVIAPQKLDEGNSRVKTDGRDGHALCLRLDRYLAGNKNSLAVIRVPSEEEERPDTGGASVNSLSITDRSWRLRVAVCLLIMVCRPLRAGGGRRVEPAKLLPVWILSHLELYRPVLLALDQQIRTLTVELESGARRTAQGHGRVKHRSH